MFIQMSERWDNVRVTYHVRHMFIQMYERWDDVQVTIMFIQMSERWDDVRVTVIRPNAVDQRGPCANSIPQDDNKATNLPAGMFM